MPNQSLRSSKGKIQIIESQVNSESLSTTHFTLRRKVEGEERSAMHLETEILKQIVW